MTDHPLLDHLPRVEKILAAVARRHHLSHTEAEDFSSHVRLKLWEDKGAAIESFRGQSTFDTYLTTVVTRLFLDYRRQQWGRWRPSAAAKRAGPVGERLDRLLHRDQVPFDQAAEMLRRNHGVQMSVQELAHMAATLGQRPPRPSEQQDEDLERFEEDRESVDLVEDSERRKSAEHAERVFREVLTELDDVDRFLVRTLAGGLTVSEVASMLGEEQKPLYRRRDRLVVSLRGALEERGLTAAEVADILDWGQAEMDFGLRTADSEDRS